MPDPQNAHEGAAASQGLRVAVVGATGNAGTALLRALAQAPEVTSILGIARRMPDATAEPYASAEWASVDVAAASPESAVVERLTELFQGVDAVVHLAWLIQPLPERELLRRVNVEGTRRVLRAAAAAGVTQVVVASSVGVYAADPSTALRDEHWERGGIETSQYSVDKVAQEEVLDAFEVEHPEIAVTRLRPALVFQGDAASSIQRYFLSGAVPVQALKHARPPALPLPKGWRGVQAVHAEDLADAYTRAIVRRAPGAFNICADDVLGPQQLADIIDHGRYFELPTPIVRGFVTAAYRSGLISVDAGWFDLGLGAAHMDNSRAKQELGWQPTRTAADALRELIQGMIDGRGADSIPLRARDIDEARLSSLDGRVNGGEGNGGEGNGSEPSGAEPGSGTAGAPADGGSHAPTGSAANAGETNAAGGSAAESPTAGSDAGDSPSHEKTSENSENEFDWEIFGLYLSDHLTGATAGAERMERMSASYIDTPVYAGLSELAEELRLERAFLAHLIDDLEVRRRPYRQAAAWVGEHVGRLKLNGRVFSRSPLSLLLELELLRSAVIGKLGLWQTLGEHADELGLDADVFSSLSDRALAQASVLDAAHEYARARAFRQNPDTFGSDEDPATAAPSGPDPLPDAGAPAKPAAGAAAATGSAAVTGVAAVLGDGSTSGPNAERAAHDHDDALADEWGEESFPGSDPPGHY
ncbi:NAD-dependent epimerase/dehydratase family protein [Leucobacter sp. USHLN153]|uniref:NAD-dependent epimerase/dehydratase family protein n=1 Tax=Leucobacter sp. USHLN153 TaxID=3081268 RepID=UPI0030197632